MRDGLSVRTLEGGLPGPAASVLPDFAGDVSDLPASRTDRRWWLFRRTVVVTVSDEGSIPTRIRERVVLGPRWLWTLVIATALAAVGVAGAAVRGPSPAWTGLGTAGGLAVICCWRAALVDGELAPWDLRDPDERYHLLGPFLATAVPVFVAVAAGGAVGTLSAVGATAAALALAASARFRTRLGSVGRRLHRAVPLVPALHAAFSLAAAVTVFGYVYAVTDLTVSFGPVAGATAVSATAALLAVRGFRTRAGSRSAVVAAAAVTAVAFLAALFSTLADGVRIAEPAVTEATLVAAVGVAGAWLVGVSVLALAGTAVPYRFHEVGRGVDTRTAATFAYLSIVGSGSLLAATGTFLAVAGAALATAADAVATAAATLLYGVPVWFAFLGVAYQLGETARNAYAYRRGATADRLDTDPLPIEPAYPVRVLDADGFLAAAYADPTTAYVALSPETVESLSDAELAAVVAHEESHLRERGALLQVAFAVVPAAALMGKNVVFGLYDFLQRERTADAHAVGRLNDAGVDGSRALAGALDAAEGADPAPDSMVGFLPTATTVPERNGDDSPFTRPFAPFFGDFAGSVHPATSRRRERIRRLDDDLSAEDVRTDPGTDLVE